mmetsp:Transcript_29789/g.72612  ORF Transcript_29789/g.72612 Transcript_29789/m.72612 type:complete len:137 (+) Transcript_29789:117-527(+)
MYLPICRSTGYNWPGRADWSTVFTFTSMICVYLPLAHCTFDSDPMPASARLPILPSQQVDLRLLVWRLQRKSEQHLQFPKAEQKISLLHQLLQQFRLFYSEDRQELRTSVLRPLFSRESGLSPCISTSLKANLCKS